MRKQNQIIYFLYLTIALFSISASSAQDIGSLKARGNELYNQKFYLESIPVFRELLIYDNSMDAKVKLAQAYRITGQARKAKYWYEQILAVNTSSNDLPFEYAQVLQGCGMYDEAATWYMKCVSWNPQAQGLAQNCKNIKSYYGNEKDIELTPLNINTSETELSPILYNNGFVFASSRKGSNKSEQVYESKDINFLDLYYTEGINTTTYKDPVKIKGAINTNLHDGPACFNRDASMLYFTRNGDGHKDLNGTKILKIYTANYKKNGSWGDTKDFIHNNDRYSVGHPSISADDEQIYFISDMPGGYGGADIYVCYMIDSLWSVPINLGPTVNTTGDELFPFIHQDGTLFFSSNGHPGIGGFDMFYTTRVNGQWAKPINCKAPINSPMDDLCLVLDNAKNTGFLTTNREGGAGKEDIYSVYVKNPVLSPAIVSPNNTTLSTPTQNLAPYEVNSFINGQLAILDVPFDFKKTYLTFGGQTECDKVISLMNRYKQLVISIEAHTDAQGEASANEELTQVMANNLKDYMISRGISGERLVAKGFGETYIINECRDGVVCTDDGHRANRRVMFRVLSNSGIKPMTEPTVSTTVGEVKAYEPTVVINPPLIEPTPPKSKKKDKKKSGDDNEFIDFSEDKQVNTSNTSNHTDSAVEEPVRSNKKDKKNKTNIPSRNTGFDEEVQEEEIKMDEVTEAPIVFATDDDSGLKFAIVLGPYPADYPKLIIAINKLNIVPSFTTTEDGSWARVGYFTTIAESEIALKYFKKNDFKKSAIIPYADGRPTDLVVKQLKKQGIK